MKNINADEYPRYELLYRLLWEKENLNEKYDAILIDPNARAEDLLYNAIYAMRTLIAPVKPAGKGSLSLDGLEELVVNMQTNLDIEIGLSCVVPSGVRRTNAHKQYLRYFENSDAFDTPVVIGDRESMMDDMWEARGSAFKVIEDRWKTIDDDSEGGSSKPGVRKVRDREVETLVDLYRLAAFVATDTFGMDIEPVLELHFDGQGSRTINLRDQEEIEVTET